MRTLTLKLLPGEDLLQSIEKVAMEENASGFVLGVIGNLSTVLIKCPGFQKPRLFEGNLEIITLNGTFSSNQVHLHLSFSDSDCNVWGGHLEASTYVKKGCEILLGFVSPNDTKQIPLETKTSSIESVRLEVAVLPGCPWSKRAQRILDGLEVPYTLKMIDSEQSYEDITKSTDVSIFPQFFLDGQFLGGYEVFAELHSKGKLLGFK